MPWKLLFFAGAMLVALAAPKALLRLDSSVTAPVRIAYGPGNGFDSIDLDLIGRARDRIDMAAYVLSDQRIIEALSAAAERGVKIRIYLDPEQFRRIADANVNVVALVNQPNVSARIKAEQNDMMHLKTFAVDGRWLRAGSANFSWAGERRQDNDILVIDSPEAAGAFTRHFDSIWARRDNSEASR
ncbi:phosphatidylserine/phosphatidylglycerophosphate/cardiolipin synthase-like enzyme [Rhodoblastus acidophilus]|uniref:phospholipase D-like domain-containing protein n=1 Tax=Rhodoblastus acidophilus TaxID=1074 RepID=UPI002224261E|nr:phospholipase D-like domain-containing protein [Rhodoblastus acidophilus]MCW2285854.1 phosphatidylserine/phosphatidylglycerophosphate/cardiolipin synthase-like enzyme [Rhodoblastus acidophilus]MCW2334748.1 phosphatidylserine/phosphatidylglycerophosphate/cardiolipin synthase-like enzyme [Rhodoblastus acidophilus]